MAGRGGARRGEDPHACNQWRRNGPSKGSTKWSRQTWGRRRRRRNDFAPPPSALRPVSPSPLPGPLASTRRCAQPNFRNIFSSANDEKVQPGGDGKENFSSSRKKSRERKKVAKLGGWCGASSKQQAGSKLPARGGGTGLPWAARCWPTSGRPPPW